MQYILCDIYITVQLIGWLSNHTVNMGAKDSDQTTAVPSLLCIQKNLLRLFCIRNDGLLREVNVTPIIWWDDL
jgi:hypothetical protein